MNQRCILAIVAFICAVTLNAQVRESVVVVRPRLSDEGAAAYHSIAGYFRNKNLGDLADYFESLIKGGYGSGYIATDRYGRSVVITNRHVVTFADSATITLSKDDGKEISVDNCQVAYEGEDIDCALLLLPQGAFEGAPRLELAESVPADGDTVWSAGYPSLFGKPSWQLGKGVVTNRRVVVEKIGLPEYAVFTQHSAPIDPGNSGGPLLVGDPGDPSSFRVIGINTWVMLGRQSTNFAVSLDMLREVLERLPDPVNTIEPAGAVREKAEKLVTSINVKEWSRFESGRYISSRMVMRQGWNVFTSIVSAAEAADYKVWVERFLGESPEETLRQAIYFRIYKALHKEGRAVALDSVDTLPDAGGTRRIRTGLTAGRDTFFIDWYEKSGNWRILEAGIPSAGLLGPQKRVEVPPAPREKMPPEGYLFPSGLLISAGVTSIPTIYGWQVGFSEEIGYHMRIGRIASVGASFVCDEGASLVQNPTRLPLISQSMLMIVSVAAEARIGFPILLQNVTLFPFVSGSLRTGLTTAGMGSGIIRISVEADTGLLLRPSSKWSIGVSLGPSFATDNGLRLEGIPVKLLLLF
jgi:serine protease Do